jgi:hypothetical protein
MMKKEESKRANVSNARLAPMYQLLACGNYG